MNIVLVFFRSLVALKSRPERGVSLSFARNDAVRLTRKDQLADSFRKICCKRCRHFIACVHPEDVGVLDVECTQEVCDARSHRRHGRWRWKSMEVPNPGESSAMT